MPITKKGGKELCHCQENREKHILCHTTQIMGQAGVLFLQMTTLLLPVMNMRQSGLLVII